MIESTRRRVMGALNSRFIYGRVPLLHALVLLVEMAILARLVTKFNSYYADKPVLTIMITNAILWGMADTVAQTLTSVRTRANRRANNGKNDFVSIEIADLDEKRDPAHEMLPSARHAPPPFDFERLTRFAAYGFIMSPVQFHWFAFLSKAFPRGKGAATVPALKMVACDQLIFAPFSLAAFFTFMTIAEGGGRRAVTKKLQDIYLPALKANWMVWPAVQMLNFRVVPQQFQIPFVSTISIVWTAYLSLTNSADDS